MAYFDTKKDSLEEAIKAAVKGQIKEKSADFIRLTFNSPTEVAKTLSLRM